jgi:SAM-dependent methyltransferase
LLAFEPATNISDDSLPLKLGRDEDFARVRSCLQSAGFDETNLCRHLKIEALCDFEKVNPGAFQASPDESPALVWLTRLFFLLQDVPACADQVAVSAEALDSMQALGLIGPADSSPLEPDQAAGPRFRSRVWLYPVAGFFLASDRDKTRPDAVFPAVSPLTFRFLRRLDDSPVSASLELCCGTGAAALVLSRNSQKVVASDVSARAAHFARFNFRLNHCDHAQAVESDLYSALGGQTFDRIVAHPPYVPSVSNLVVWRDGGETGETAIRKIVEGLRQHLRPGGAFFSACGGFDTIESGFEHRVRHWLGDGHAAFDVLLGVDFEKSPWHLATELAGGAVNGSNDTLRRLLDGFASFGARNFVIGALYIERRVEADAGPVPPLTLRKQLSLSADGGCFRRYLGMLRWLGRMGGPNALQSLQPRLADGFLVRISHQIQHQELVPVSFVAETTEPFRTETRLEAEMIDALCRCDGQTRLLELFAAARQANRLPEHVDLLTFLKFAVKMMELGYLQVAEPAGGTD